jgi:AraC-like DNA-binding protein
VPWFYKPAVANAVFPALGAHLHGVKFRYWDNVEHEGTFMNILIGGQSIGKGSIKKPIQYIMEDIRLRDLPNRLREAAWKQRNSGNKQKNDPRPADICIQMLIDNLTDAVFNQRIVDANNNGERYVYTIVDEIEALKKVTSKGTVDEVGLLIRKAFDNSMAGQERVGADSVSGIAPLRWNFNASTTPPNARKFLYKMVNDGTLGRLDISTIIRDEDDATEPIYGLYDQSFADELCITPKYLSAVCKRNSGKTANAWITEHLMEDIRYYLRQTDLSIKEVCSVLGFPNASFFGKYVKEHFGVTPTQLRQQ